MESFLYATLLILIDNNILRTSEPHRIHPSIIHGTFKLTQQNVPTFTKYCCNEN